MLDPKLIRSNPEIVRATLEKRGADPSLLKNFLDADELWRKKLFEFEQIKSRQNEISAQIAKAKKTGEDTEKLFLEVKKIAEELKSKNVEIKMLEEKACDIALLIPNILSDTTPIGKDPSDNKEIRRWGEARKFSFAPKSHDEIGEKLGILNFKQAAKMSSSRFVVYHGLGVKLEMALINFMLDFHSKENGYNLVMTPYLVNKNSMIGTGQLPKFEEELYKTNDDMYLIPTAEVSVTNIHREEILDVKDLPKKYAAYTPCFRREAGSYGKDVKGIIRQHQFNKVELVKFCVPESSHEELELLTSDAEKILQTLNLPYRVISLCSGDLGFASAKTYDIEVWFPSENKYKEISSCSNFLDFQARRAEIKFRRDAKSKPEFVHTLNGSGLAVGRTFAAILENYQREDGFVGMPEAVVPYIGCEFI